MNTDKKLKQMANDYDPDVLQTQRIKSEVFRKLNIEEPKKRFNIFDSIYMNRKALLAFGSLAAVAVFIGVPLLYNLTTVEFGMANLESSKKTADETYNSTGGIMSPTSIDSNYGYDGIVSESLEQISDIFRKSEDEDTTTEESERAKEKFAELFLRVEDISQSITDVYELTATVEGYVINSYYDSDIQNGYGEVSIRVPSDKFDFTVKELRGMAVEVVSESTNIIDLQNQITNNENSLTELRTDLEAEYAKLETATGYEKTSIENEIKRIENQIEIIEESLSQLEQKASFSTIDIQFTQEEFESGELSIWDTVEQAWEQALMILEFWAKAGVWLVLIVPTLGLPVILFVIAKKAKKVLKNRKEKEE